MIELVNNYKYTKAWKKKIKYYKKTNYKIKQI